MKDANKMKVEGGWFANSYQAVCNVSSTLQRSIRVAQKVDYIVNDLGKCIKDSVEYVCTVRAVTEIGCKVLTPFARVYIAPAFAISAPVLVEIATFYGACKTAYTVYDNFYSNFSTTVESNNHKELAQNEFDSFCSDNSLQNGVLLA